MYTLQGFYNFGPLVDNTIGRVSPIGELSDLSKSFARDKGEYTNGVYAPQTTLYAFHSVKDTEVVLIPTGVAETTLRVGQHLLNQSLVGNLSSNPNTTLQNLTTEFAGKIGTVTTGEMITNGTYWLPEWIQFEDLTHIEHNTLTIWMADDSFRGQYTNYEIYVVPPIDKLDDFFKDPLDVKVIVDGFDLTQRLELVASTYGQYPHTTLINERYNYINPANANFKVPTNWLVVVYGQAGNNPDSIRQSIVDYVLANSTHDRADWARIMPELFRSTEMILMPFWVHYATAANGIQGGLYSPTVNPTDDLKLFKKIVKGDAYSAQWITDNYEVTGIMYKSLAMAIIGNPENQDGIVRFSKRFQDYMVLPNDSGDISRISEKTQGFMRLLDGMIPAAESLSLSNVLLAGYGRVERDKIVYLSAKYDGVVYLLASRASVEAVYYDPLNGFYHADATSAFYAPLDGFDSGAS